MSRSAVASGLIVTWAVGPTAALVMSVLAGSLSLPEAVDLGIWLVLPWATILAGLLLLRAIVSPGRGRTR